MNKAQKAVIIVMGVGGVTAPTCTITSSASSPTGTIPIPVAITFSEEVVGFTVGDIVCTGVASNFATIDNIVFTFNQNPTAPGAQTVDVAAGVCTDLAGNPNQAAAQFSIAYSPWALVFNGTNATVNCGSDAGLDNLADNEFTVEIFIKIHASPLANQQFLDKEGFGGVGWNIYRANAPQRLEGRVQCATTDAYTPSGNGSLSGTDWHHIVMYFNDAGDRKVYIAKDGVWADMAGAIAGIGAIVSDAAQNFRIGGPGTYYQWKGNLGWCRVSNNDRYGHGVNFTPPQFGVYPAVDANTLALWKMNEGTGTALDNAEGTAARDGVCSNTTWEQQTF